jgi:hypothetical protein
MWLDQWLIWRVANSIDSIIYVQSHSYQTICIRRDTLSITFDWSPTDPLPKLWFGNQRGVIQVVRDYLVDIYPQIRSFNPFNHPSDWGCFLFSNLQSYLTKVWLNDRRGIDPPLNAGPRAFEGICNLWAEDDCLTGEKIDRRRDLTYQHQCLVLRNEGPYAIELLYQFCVYVLIYVYTLIHHLSFIGEKGYQSGAIC